MKNEYPGVIQSIPKIRADLNHVAVRQEIPDSELKQITYIVEELFSMIIRFNSIAGPDAVYIGLTNSENSIVLEIEWLGEPFNPADEVVNETFDPMAGDEGGMGLILIKTFADAIEYSRQVNLNIIKVRKSIRTANR